MQIHTRKNLLLLQRQIQESITTKTLKSLAITQQTHNPNPKISYKFSPSHSFSSASIQQIKSLRYSPSLQGSIRRQISLSIQVFFRRLIPQTCRHGHEEDLLHYSRRLCCHHYRSFSR